MNCRRFSYFHFRKILKRLDMTWLTNWWIQPQFFIYEIYRRRYLDFRSHYTGFPLQGTLGDERHGHIRILRPWKNPINGILQPQFSDKHIQFLAKLVILAAILDSAISTIRFLPPFQISGEVNLLRCTALRFLLHRRPHERHITNYNWREAYIFEQKYWFWPPSWISAILNFMR